MKQCTSCKQTKPLSEFRKRAASKDGYQGSCRTCRSRYETQWYKGNTDRQEKIRKLDVVRIAANRDAVWDYLLDHPCIDCGESDPVVLDFDHQGDKLGNISTMVKGSTAAKIMAEIEKCLVRCSNCHRRKTAKEFGWWKLAR